MDQSQVDAITGTRNSAAKTKDDLRKILIELTCMLYGNEALCRKEYKKIIKMIEELDD